MHLSREKDVRRTYTRNLKKDVSKAYDTVNPDTKTGGGRNKRNSIRRGEGREREEMFCIIIYFVPD